MIMTSKEEVTRAICLYMCLCVILLIIYIFTESDKFFNDFRASLSKTRLNITFLKRNDAS